MYFDRLEKNLIDIIKEEQAKLGFRKEAIRLYYPLSSLNHFFEAEDSEAEMLARLSGFPASLTKKLGNVTAVPWTIFFPYLRILLKMLFLKK